ncbi:MAG TPA: VTT domain-containing protein [Verrucomicrobiae bacterium]|nr:VTT domain-containing protein [Verrucomicrobiae bacterium]
MAQLIDLFLHLDTHLSQLISWAGGWSYAALFLVIFCETGLVIAPFLPGDSFLFASGSLATLDGMNIWVLTAVLFFAAFLGNELNYWIGRNVGLKILEGPFKRWVNPNHLRRAEVFFAKYGAKAVVLSRFMPIVRTVVPFVAGVGKMDPRRYSIYNAAGAAAWVILFTWAGYLFGNIPGVKHNFSLVILVIIIISFIPPVIEWWKARRGNDKIVET